MVAEEEHPLDLGTAGREDVEVHLRVGSLEHPVLEPVGLADAEDVARGLERRHVRRLVGRVGHDEHDVDDPLCGEPGDGRRARVLDAQRRLAERLPDARLLACEEARPLGVVLDEDDRLGRRQGAVDPRCAELFVRRRALGHTPMMAKATYAAAPSSTAAAPSIIAPATISNAAPHAASYSGFHASPATAAIEAISTAPTTG